jgi:hypothetical protein
LPDSVKTFLSIQVASINRATVAIKISDNIMNKLAGLINTEALPKTKLCATTVVTIGESGNKINASNLE